jgi:hypothetical protein
MEIEIEKSDDKKEKKYGKYEDYEIENAARTLMESEEIKKDSEKMKYVAQCLKHKGEAYEAALGKISNLDDLKKAAKKKSME